MHLERKTYARESYSRVVRRFIRRAAVSQHLISPSGDTGALDIYRAWFKLTRSRNISETPRLIIACTRTDARGPLLFFFSYDN